MFLFGGKMKKLFVIVMLLSSTIVWGQRVVDEEIFEAKLKDYKNAVAFMNAFIDNVTDANAMILIRPDPDGHLVRTAQSRALSRAKNGDIYGCFIDLFGYRYYVAIWVGDKARYYTESWVFLVGETRWFE